MVNRNYIGLLVELLFVLLPVALFLLLGPSLLLGQLIITPNTFHAVMLILSLVVPIYLVLRFRGLGIIIATLYQWMMLTAEVKILAAYDPHGGQLLDSFWLYTGGILALAYSVVIYAVIQVIKMIQEK